MTQAELRNIRGHAKGVRVNINLVFIGDRPEWHLLNLLWVPIFLHMSPCCISHNNRGQTPFNPARPLALS